MNWSALTFDWNQVRAFLATAEEGSLSAAARALKQSQPTLGRQVSALEESLGVVLFERVGRSLALTPTGRDLLDHVRAMGAAAERVSLIAAGQSQTVEGRVSISASDAMAAYVLPSALATLQQAAPGIEIEVIASNAISDLQRREADIAIRHIRPEEPELFARLLGEETAHLYAAPSYLDRRGRPETMADLAKHDVFGFADPDRTVMEFNKRGLPVQRGQIRIFSESGLVTFEMARQGLGIAVMADSVVARSSGLERVLHEFEVRFPVWLAVHREVQTSRRIRLVYDHLAEALKQRA
ncbi:LysR family transcriptional regulator [Ovoidimarina sediminis]|uniref:LysR family transcriptional regulator n=1 Tax=Ovoidimarina sediminis TaxID=3079856 RepID=UPI0029085DEB|nr:LysR family transcriptional regulator [Rhodophyticola sp. MJ-SS7]MDU8943971.1 LysR family transcriptional regulator [Rhodophyticola sp. MJ-SS7]